MVIRKLTLQHYRKFSNTAFHLGDVNVLVGPNNCGKTSVLNALRLVFSVATGNFEGPTGRAKFHKRYIPVADIAGVPDALELWTGKNKSKGDVVIGVQFAAGPDVALRLKWQFGQVHASASIKAAERCSGDDLNELFGRKVVYIPGLVGLLVQEPYVTPGRRAALSSEARYSEVFRSSLLHLRNTDKRQITRINRILKESFGLHLSTIEFDAQKDVYVRVMYDQEGVEHDIASAGSGLQQVIQLLTYVYLHKPHIILIDEPDAHLHPQLQAAVGQVIRQIATDLRAQVLVSTHSPEVIDGFSLSEVFFVDAAKTNVQALTSESQYVSALASAGVLTSSSLSRLSVLPDRLVIEDALVPLYRRIDQVLGTRLMASPDGYVKARGVSKFPTVNEVYEAVRSVTGKKINLHFIQDSDGLPDRYLGYQREQYKGKGLRVQILSRHEIENYTLDAKIIRAALGVSGVSISLADTRKLLCKAADNLKHNACYGIRERAKHVNHSCGKPEGLDDKEVELDVDRWFGAMKWNESSVLKYFPGKELLNEVCRLCKEDLGVELTAADLMAQLTRKRLAPDIGNVFNKIARASAASRG